MKAQAFLNLVGEMMAAQQAYFKARTQHWLMTAKDLEKRVREVVKEGGLEPDDIEAVDVPIQENLFSEEQ